MYYLFWVNNIILLTIDAIKISLLHICVIFVLLQMELKRMEGMLKNNKKEKSKICERMSEIQSR